MKKREKRDCVQCEYKKEWQKKGINIVTMISNDDDD
jgi:hypothetical protein